MKVFSKAMKIFAAVAAVAGAIYVVAAYGDKIVNWAKSLCNKFGRCHRSYFCDLSDIDEMEDCDFSDIPSSVTTHTVPADAADESDFEN